MNISKRFSQMKALIPFSEKHGFHEQSVIDKVISNNYDYIYLRLITFNLCDIASLIRCALNISKISWHFTANFIKMHQKYMKNHKNW